MTPIPNKRTVLAAVVYGLCKQQTKPARVKGDIVLPWSSLTSEQKTPYIQVTDFLDGQLFGAQLEEFDRAKLAANLEKQAFEVLKDVNANTIVSTFVNAASVLS